MKIESDRLYFIDNIKIALMMLVVAHHAGQAYGPGGWWFFLDDESINWLGRFFSVNAAFFISMFFFLSAYFLPPSIVRKGPKTVFKRTANSNWYSITTGISRDDTYSYVFVLH